VAVISGDQPPLISFRLFGLSQVLAFPIQGCRT
jgi:hypothetical protein